MFELVAAIQVGSGIADFPGRGPEVNFRRGAGSAVCRVELCPVFSLRVQFFRLSASLAPERTPSCTRSMSAEKLLNVELRWIFPVPVSSLHVVLLQPINILRVHVVRRYPDTIARGGGRRKHCVEATDRQAKCARDYSE